jgi:hypothetical protein
MADEVTNESAGEVASTDPVSTEVVEASSTPAPAAVDGGTPAEQKMFDEKYVNGLRDEAAKYRTERNKYKDTFDNYDEDQQEQWLGLMQAVIDDPTNAYSTLQEIADAIKDQHADVFDDANRPLTMADINAMKEAELQEKAVEQVFNQVRSITDPITGKTLDPNEPRGVYALVLADRNGNDFAKVQEILEAEKHAIIDNYVQGKFKDAQGTPKAPAASGGAPSTESASGFGGDLKAAREAALAHLAQKLPQ